jgi:hypothetical protein
VGLRWYTDVCYSKIADWDEVPVVVLGGLRWYKAPTVVFCAAIIVLSGYPATVILAGLLCRRFTKGGVPVGTKFPPNTGQPQSPPSDQLC